MTKTAAKLMPLTDDALATVSGAHKRGHGEHEHGRGHGRGGKFTDQFSGIANVVFIFGDNNTVNIDNSVSQKA